jgi:glycosyltransferase involved in cell wall biosynthesis
MSNSDFYCFIGGMFPKELEDSIAENSITGLQNAANGLQWKMLDGLDACVGIDRVSVINSLYIGSFPRRYKKIYINRSLFAHAGETAKDVNTSFVNLPLIKEFFRSESIKREIKKYLKKLPSDAKVFFIGYAASYPIVQALLYAKQICPQCSTCLVVPDLPDYMDLQKKGPGKIKAIKNKLVTSRMVLIDSFALLTKQMADYLKLESRRYVVVEGIANEGALLRKEKENVENVCKTILYSGTLQYKYGIMDLLKAFLSLQEHNVKLIICGDGEATEEIKRLSKINNGIVYLGVVSGSKARELQVTADLLVNPRNDSDEYTKYSFPSKMMDYLSSGTPVVAYQLSGMPEEYGEYFIKANNIGLEKALKKALSMKSEDLKRLSDDARRFVLNEKSSQKQMSKIIDLMHANQGEGNE